MSEQSNNQERIEAMQIAINKAAEIVGGPGANPLEVFPDPSDKERRADVVWGEDLSADEQDAVRGIVADLGPGRETNFGPLEARLEDAQYVALFEGGQPHKMIAQLNVIEKSGIRPSQYIVSGSSDRELPDTERLIGANLLGLSLEETPSNELEMAMAVIRSIEGFYPRDNELTAVSVSGKSGATGQIMMVGAIEGRGVQRLNVLRNYGEDGRYTQLSNAEKITVVADVAEGQPVAFVTSATYVPSNELQALHAAEEAETDVHVLSYGTYELADVKGEQLVPPSIAQIGAEAFKTAKLLASK